MAYYTYKDVCNDFPEHILAQFEAERGCEPDMDPNYNGDCWILAGMWIKHLEEEIASLKEEIEITQKHNNPA